MAAQTALITGGNGGLGYEAAQRIAASDDWHVVVASRDLDRSNDAVSRLRETSANRNIAAKPLDLGSLTSVRQFAATFAEREAPPLRAIVCNAGVQAVQGLSKTRDGFESTIGVNHFGHFLLVNLLLRHVAAPARIILVSSDTHDPARKTGMPVPRWEDPHFLAWPDWASPRIVEGF